MIQVIKLDKKKQVQSLINQILNDEIKKQFDMKNKIKKFNVNLC
jgi:hypothetical protein